MNLGVLLRRGFIRAAHSSARSDDVVIRPAHMSTLSEASVERFETSMVVHLNKCFPDQCRALGEPRVRETIRYGIERASVYGITAQRDVCKYIDLMFVFGQ